MVEWKKLGDVCTFNRGRTITAKEAVEGSVPVIAGGQAPSYYHNEANRSGESITVAGSGAYAGFVIYWNQPIFVSDAFTVDPDKSLLHKYVFQWLKMNQQRIFETQKGAGVPHVHGKDIAGFVIPIPPLSEQTRIVGILDTFTAAIENLKQQIAERRKQYDYYRDELLDLEGKEGVEMKTLGEICLKITDGSHFSPQAVEQGYYMPSVKDMRSNGFDFSSCKQISKTDYENLVNNGCKPKLNDVLIAKDGSILKYVFPVVEEENIVVLSSIAILTPKQNVINSQFLSYYLIQDKIKERTIREFSSKGGVPRIILKNFKKVNIVYPSLAEQRRIVSILAPFEESIQVLEKQLKLREKQYEYYREKLLTFE